MVNNIIPFKNRVIDYEKPVRVFRNLNKSGRWYSIRQKNKTVAHTNNLLLGDCTLVVNEKTRERVRKTKKKEVHAFVQGYISYAQDLTKMNFKLEYNPFTNDNFILTLEGSLISHCNKIKLVSFNDKEGLRAQL